MKRDLRGRGSGVKRRGFLALSNQGFLGRTGRIDFVGLGGPQLEFPGHLADGERPTAVHGQPVLAQRALGESRVSVLAQLRRRHSITRWPVPSTASKIHQHPWPLPRDTAPLGHQVLVSPCHSETHLQSFAAETTLTDRKKSMSTSFFSS